jgi:phosphinothricin acetyltransferase
LELKEIGRRIANADEESPWLVLLEDNQLVGFACAVPWKLRAAYRFSRETSIYLQQDKFGKGRGARLYQQLIDEIRKTPIHVLIAGIAQPNPGSVALHEKMGFREIGQFRELGNKFDNFIDIAYWQLTL